MANLTIDTSIKVEEVENISSPNSIFRWESSPGLEHTCYACETKANSPKAKQTCFGIHSIPCSRYHQTMHAIGTSHNCFACVQADSLHEKRHREISELVAKYKALEEAEVDEGIKNKKGKHVQAAHGMVLRERVLNVNAHPPHREPAEHHNHDHDIVVDENDFILNGTHLTPPSKPTKAEQRSIKREARAQKSQLKSLKNQSKHVVSVKASDVELVHTVLHGEPPHDQPGDAMADQSRHPLASDKSVEDVIERNRNFVGAIREHKFYLLQEVKNGRKEAENKIKDKRAARKRKDRESFGSHGHTTPSSSSAAPPSELVDDEAEQLIDSILIKFDIVVNTGISSHGHGNGTDTTAGGAIVPRRSSSSATANTKSAVLAALRTAIKEDLEKYENEQRQTAIRAGGFWRYVGKPVFERMMGIATEIDWKTGVIR